MGAHAFLDAPQHAHAYLAIRDPAPRLFGLAQGWNMPVVRHEAALGEGADFPGVDHFVITCHLRGARVRRVDDPRFALTWADRSAISFETPGSGCSVRSEEGRAVRYAHLYCRQSLFDEVSEALGRPRIGPMQDFFGRADVGCDQEIAHYLARAAALDDPPSVLEMDSRANLIALALARAATMTSRSHELTQARPLDRKRVGAALAFIEDRLGHQPSLSEIAESLGLSAFHFARSFKAATGEAPAAYVARRQAERARDMIAHTKLPLAEIAVRAGYSSQSHMTRRIKSIFGDTPARMRTGDERDR